MRHHAVDLDGTLAQYDGYIPGHIGSPIHSMRDRVLSWLDRGDKVSIFTARLKEHPEEKELIREWLEENVGQKLPVTNEKDPSFTDIWDDRAVAVRKNTGEILGADTQTEALEREKVMPAKSGKQYRFMAGIAHGMKPFKSTGPSKEVAREFIEKTPSKLRSKFSKGLRKRRLHMKGHSY